MHILLNEGEKYSMLINPAKRIQTRKTINRCGNYKGSESEFRENKLGFAIKKITVQGKILQGKYLHLVLINIDSVNLLQLRIWPVHAYVSS